MKKKKYQKSRFQKGWTLVEILLVISILGVLAIGIMVLLNPIEFFKKSRDTQRKTDLTAVQKTLEAYFNDHGSYPVNTADYKIPGTSWGGQWGEYLQKLPKDPTTNTYVYVSDGRFYKLFASLERGRYDAQACNNGDACSDAPTPTACGGICNFSLGIEDDMAAGSGSGGTPTATPIPTPTVFVPTSTSTPTPTPRPTFTPTPTPTPPTQCTNGMIAQDNFRRPNQTYWGTASDGNVWSGDVATNNLFTINNNTGEAATNGGAQFVGILGPSISNAEIVFTVYMTSTYSQSNMGAVLRWQDYDHFYKVDLDTGQDLRIIKGPTASGILVTTYFPWNLDTRYTIRFRAIGPNLFAKAWQTGTPEPSNWMLSLSDNSYSSGRVGLRDNLKNGAIARYTSFEVCN